MKHFGNELRRQRRKADFTQQYLADVSGLSLRYVQGLEAGENQPTLETIFRLAKAMNTTPDKLIMPPWEKIKKTKFTP